MLKQKLKRYNVILASGSPRRKHLLEEMGIEFSIKSMHADETFPQHLSPSEAAEYVSKLKADAFFSGNLEKDDLVIAADTVVTIGKDILGKPTDRDDAVAILEKLSGKTHQVITGVTLKTKSSQHTFSVTTDVTFKKLTSEEIHYYIDTYHPFDKAGAYGIQEWIGHVAIERIEGSYFNVMGLPTHRLYEELLGFIQ